MVTATGTAVNDLGPGVASLGAGTPIAPITSGVGTIVANTGSGVEQLGNQLGGLLDSNQSNALTQALSSVVTPVAASLGTATSPESSTNLVAAVGTGTGALATGLSAVSYTHLTLPTKLL